MLGTVAALALAGAMVAASAAEPTTPVPLDYAGLTCGANDAGEVVLTPAPGAPAQVTVNLGGAIAGDEDCAVAISGDTLIVLARGTDGQYFREAANDHWTDAVDWSPWQRVGVGPTYHTS